MEYVFKTKPFAHQLEEFELSREMEARAILWEQGTGKTKLTVDTACWLYMRGLIDGVLVLAPNGVHRNWITDEIPTHAPDDILKQCFGHVYQPPKASTVWHKKLCQKVIMHKGFAWLAMSYDAFMTEKGKQVAWDFMSQRRILYVLDESSMVKGHLAQRTKSIVKSGKFAPFRRILNGTPIANGPFDAFTQFKFLDIYFWVKHELDSFSVFKTFFGIWKRRVTYKDGEEREFEQLVGFKNLDKLNQMIMPISSRVLKEDVLDLPAKIYQKRYFELTPEQQRLYDEVRDEFMTFLDSGSVVTAPLAITRLLRMQQICSGYVPPDDGEEPMYVIPGKNPRLDLLMEQLEMNGHGKAIIWARFKMDIDLIMAALKERGIKAVRYDGQVDDDERAEAKALFTGRRPIMEGGKVVRTEQIPPSEQAIYFVANPDAAATGLTLIEAEYVYYYTNSYKLIARLQSEDRCHRIGQTKSVVYTDIIAGGTIDEKIVKALAKKFDIASQIVGDDLREWL